MYEELKDMLYAWVVSRSDEGLGYVQGTARIAAMILLNMSAGPGFIAMKNLLDRHCMRSFYGGLSTKDDVSPTSTPQICVELNESPLFSGRGILQVNCIRS
jgi:hypothetical protein